MKGFLLIDKPKGITSFDVVRQIRRLTSEKQVGHAGTLDPLATGLLVVAVGAGTKLLEYFVGCEKEYEVVAHFGYASDTYDAEGVISKISDDVVSLGGVEQSVLAKFSGEISQVPPKYSALKIGGKKAYDLARKGADFELKSRTVRVDKFVVEDFNWPRVSFRIACGSGTYIRSLVHDLGGELGVGAYVEELRRSKVGKFLIEDACKLDDLSKNIEQALVPLENVVRDFPFLELDDGQYKKLKQGQFLSIKIDQDGPVMAFYQKKLVGVLGKTVTSLVKFRKQI